MPAPKPSGTPHLRTQQRPVPGHCIREFALVGERGRGHVGTAYRGQAWVSGPAPDAVGQPQDMPVAVDSIPTAYSGGARSIYRRHRARGTSGAPAQQGRAPGIGELSLSYKNPSAQLGRLELMSETVNPIPEGYHSITVFIAVSDGNAAIDFYRAVFGAEVISRNDMPDGQPAHAELKVGDSTIQLGMPVPGQNVLAPTGEWVHTSLVHYCPDVDAVIARAREHGAKVAEDPATFVTGDRYGALLDPFGHRWVVMTRVEDVSREEAERRVDEWMATQG